MRTEIANYIRVTDIILQDMRFIHLDEATESAVTVFTTFQGYTRPYEYKD